MNKLDENEKIKVLTRNAVKCLVCGTILESKYRHNYVQCCCPNEVATDGGLVYQRYMAKNLDLVENLSEYVEMTRKEYDERLEQQRLANEKLLQQRIDRGEMTFLLGQWVSNEVYKIFTDKYPEYKL